MEQPRLNLTKPAAKNRARERSRSLATLVVPSTRPQAFKRSLPIPARIPPAPPIQPLVIKCYLKTPLATRTRPMVWQRSLSTTPATSIRPMVRKRSIPTPPAAATRLPVFRPSIEIPPANSARPSGLVRCSTTTLTILRLSERLRSTATPLATAIQRLAMARSLPTRPEMTTRLLAFFSRTQYHRRR
jgi:hypothetical protein